MADKKPKLSQPNRKPSIKQQKALANLVENGGNVSKAMRDAGYSVATAKTPSKLTNTQAFQTFLQKAGVTDEKLVSVIKEGLEANKVVVMGKESQDAFVDVQPDHPTRHKFLETTLKIKNIGAQTEGNTVNVNFNQAANTDRREFFDIESGPVNV